MGDGAVISERVDPAVASKKKLIGNINPIRQFIFAQQRPDAQQRPVDQSDQNKSSGRSGRTGRSWAQLGALGAWAQIN